MSFPFSLATTCYRIFMSLSFRFPLTATCYRIFVSLSFPSALCNVEDDLFPRYDGNSDGCMNEQEWERLWYHFDLDGWCFFFDPPKYCRHLP